MDNGVPNVMSICVEFPRLCFWHKQQNLLVCEVWHFIIVFLAEPEKFVSNDKWKCPKLVLHRVLPNLRTKEMASSHLNKLFGCKFLVLNIKISRSSPMYLFEKNKEIANEKKKKTAEICCFSRNCEWRKRHLRSTPYWAFHFDISFAFEAKKAEFKREICFDLSLCDFGYFPFRTEFGYLILFRKIIRLTWRLYF